MLEVKNIRKIYNPGTVQEKCLFDDFSLSIPAQAVFFQYITFAEVIKDICRFFFCLLH